MFELFLLGLALAGAIFVLNLLWAGLLTWLEVRRDKRRGN